MARRIANLVIANRGEIAMRIVRTARRMGIRTVAVYSDADASALHVAAADAAVRIGPAPARQSYLDIDAILAAACRAGADAVHPGYGFLAESAEFARACEKAGLLFIGPPPSAIELMGDKARARQLAQSLGLPVVPGYGGDGRTGRRFAEEAEAIGYPVLIKPVAGGGGKGMRVVEAPGDLTVAMAASRREAEAAFGDGRLMIEKYVARPRHIEVQIFADRAGHVVHLFERDCSIQRRHQKLIEEAPAAGVPESLLHELRSAAVSLAKSCKYVSAGTVEFLCAGGQFYFMEMNTRLQVEHPVTEVVTGIDLVEWQLKIAMGEDLPLSQPDIVKQGHAIEARLCAEDPRADFLPQSGMVSHFGVPAETEAIRIDTGVASGSHVPLHYDSLIAKIIARGSGRGEAIGRLAAALRATEVTGIGTNRGLLINIVCDNDFRSGQFDTGFIADHAAALTAPVAAADRITLALAAFAALRRVERNERKPQASDPHSPWQLGNGWRLGGFATAEIRLREGGREHLISATYQEEGYALAIEGDTIAIAGMMSTDGHLAVLAGNLRLKARVIFEDAAMTLFSQGREYAFDVIDPFEPPASSGAAEGYLRSPMPGTVISVAVKAGEKVSKGTPLAIIEAMKMEHTIAAPRDGVIAAVKVEAGDQVAAGTEVAVMEAGS